MSTCFFTFECTCSITATMNIDPNALHAFYLTKKGDVHIHNTRTKESMPLHIRVGSRVRTAIHIYAAIYNAKLYFISVCGTDITISTIKRTRRGHRWCVLLSVFKMFNAYTEVYGNNPIVKLGGIGGNRKHCDEFDVMYGNDNLFKLMVNITQDDTSCIATVDLAAMSVTCEQCDPVYKSHRTWPMVYNPADCRYYAVHRGYGRREKDDVVFIGVLCTSSYIHAAYITDTEVIVAYFDACSLTNYKSYEIFDITTGDVISQSQGTPRYSSLVWTTDS